MTLFAAANSYAPGEPGTQGLDPSGFQDVSRVAHYDLSLLKGPNVWVAILGLALIAVLAHKYGGKRRR